MKKLLPLLICLIALGNIQAQIVNIPDPYFKARLLEATENTYNIARDLNGLNTAIDTNNNGEIEVSEAENIGELRIIGENISDLTGIGAFTNIQFLNIEDVNLTSLDLPPLINLVNLGIYTQSLVDINLIEITSLTHFTYSVDNGSLASLDLSQNTNLLWLLVSGSNITSLDLSQNTNLEKLLFFNNDIISNINLSQNINLKELRVERNDQLMSLDVSNNFKLESIDCDENQINSLLLGLHPNLEIISCELNNISNLDLSSIPNLIELNCFNNNLNEIDVSSNTLLETLMISHNQISDIDLSNNVELTFLHAVNNSLTSIDMSNTRVSNWIVANNQITTINVKNGIYDFGSGNFANNPVDYICVDEDELLIYQNQYYQDLSTSQLLVSDYCTFTPGGDYNTISGDIIFDSDGNDCDISDSLFPYIRLDISDGMESGRTFSNNAGEYTFYTNEGTFDIALNLENPSWFNISPTNTQIPFTDLNNTVNQNFCITANGIHNDLEIVIVPIISAQPGFDASYQITYKNKGNRVLSGSVDFSYDDSVLDLLSTSILPDAQVSGMLSWNFIDLNPFESRTIAIDFNVNSPMETPAVNIDDVLSFTATVNPVTADEIPIDNAFELNEIVVGSYDPNNITCLEGDLVSPDEIGEYLHYNINFENTGTAAATFVVVKDVINETNYDMSSLQIMYASHNMNTRINDNNIEFIFDNINLGPNEKGNVVFKIKTSDVLNVGDSVENNAEIFFDFNFPIETDIASTSFQVLSVNDFEVDNSISIYPNPTKDFVEIKSNTTIKSVKVFDIQGRTVFVRLNKKEKILVDVSDLADGIYYLKIESDTGEKIERLVKN